MRNILMIMLILAVSSCKTSKRVSKSSSEVKERTEQSTAITVKEREIREVFGDTLQGIIPIRVPDAVPQVIRASSAGSDLLIEISAGQVSYRTVAKPTEKVSKTTETDYRQDTDTTVRTVSREQEKETVKRGIPWYGWLLCLAFVVIVSSLIVKRIKEFLKPF